MKTKEIAVTENTDLILKDLQNTNKMCQMLMHSPHYKKIGEAGIFAIVEKARSIGVKPLDALNGGMFFVQGKVELTSSMMNHLIRANGHSITKDKKSDDTVCILHGKRVDNGDTWMESFSIEDAKKAGIYRNQWLRYPKDMLFARALSRLARQLFPDVIKGCYTQGEISDSPITSFDDEAELVEEENTQSIESDIITPEEAADLDRLIGEDQKYRACVEKFLEKNFGHTSLEKMPRATYDKIFSKAKEKFEEKAAVTAAA